MDELRLALLVVGVVVVAAVYLTTRRKDAAELQNSAPDTRIEPSLDGADVSEDASPEMSESMPSFSAETEDWVDEVDASEPSEAEAQTPSADVPEKVITLRIVARNGGDFSSEQAVLAMRDTGLVHGRFGIFHKLYEDEPDGETVFAAANLVEPGSFDLKNLRDQRIPGLSFFLVRPGPGRGVDSYDKMVETARSIAIALSGELVDGDGSTFSIQRERFLREELIQYELEHLNLS
ncbi:MAG: cell division protein ZipA C-terminal FtsZ-binding domain-containing protein [Pseudomonadota bacterium]